MKVNGSFAVEPALASIVDRSILSPSERLKPVITSRAAVPTPLSLRSLKSKISAPLPPLSRSLPAPPSRMSLPEPP
jgi:hypothetical protein